MHEHCCCCIPGKVARSPDELTSSSRTVSFHGHYPSRASILKVKSEYIEGNLYLTFGLYHLITCIGFRAALEERGKWP